MNYLTELTGAECKSLIYQDVGNLFTIHKIAVFLAVLNTIFVFVLWLKWYNMRNK